MSYKLTAAVWKQSKTKGGDKLVLLTYPLAESLAFPHECGVLSTCRYRLMLNMIRDDTAARSISTTRCQQ